MTPGPKEYALHNNGVMKARRPQLSHAKIEVTGYREGSDRKGANKRGGKKVAEKRKMIDEEA